MNPAPRRGTRSWTQVLAAFIGLLGIAAVFPAASFAHQGDPVPPNSTGKSSNPPVQGGLPVPGGARGGIQLAEEEFHLDSVGLRMRIPAGSQAETVRIGDRNSVQISPADANWIINIQTPVTSNEKTTISEAIDKTIQGLHDAVGVLEATGGKVGFADSQARLIDRIDDLTLAGGTAGRFFISLPADNDSRGKRRLVKGYTIFKPSPRQYVIFELICAEQDFSRARVAYETSVGTANFENGPAIADSRRLAIAAGLEFVRSLSEADYMAAMGTVSKETWYRMYMPAPNGAPMDATELGYRGVKFWKGVRGEIDPKKQRSAYARADLQEGFLAQDRSRVLVNGMVADSLTIYFMTPGRDEEAWSATTAVKDDAGKTVAIVTEMGTRLSDDMTVVMSETGKPGRTIKPAIAGEGYISQFERSLLPRLLARKRAVGEFGFYAWDSFTGAITFRRDTVNGANAMGRDAKVWDIATTVRDESKRQLTTVNDAGEMIGASLEDGRVWEMIDLASLKSLWQQKGLPTER